MRRGQSLARARTRRCLHTDAPARRHLLRQGSRTARNSTTRCGQCSVVRIQSITSARTGASPGPTVIRLRSSCGGRRGCSRRRGGPEPMVEGEGVVCGDVRAGYRARLAAADRRRPDFVKVFLVHSGRITFLRRDNRKALTPGGSRHRSHKLVPRHRRARPMRPASVCPLTSRTPHDFLTCRDRGQALTTLRTCRSSTRIIPTATGSPRPTFG